jgi:hypothetical protein
VVVVLAAAIVLLTLLPEMLVTFTGSPRNWAVIRYGPPAFNGGLGSQEAV